MHATNFILKKKYYYSLLDKFTQFNLCLQVSFNPQDNTQLCVVGNGIFKHFRYHEGAVKPFLNFQKMEAHSYLCHAWVSDERVVVGTDTGHLFLFEQGEAKNEFNPVQHKDEK